MDNIGFVRVAAASPELRVADCEYNTQEILKVIQEAVKEDVSVIVFPEMCITSYTAQDLLFQRILLEDTIKSVKNISEYLRDTYITAIVGAPLEINNRLYNTAIVIQNGKIRGIVPKTFLPNYHEFYDMRWFASSRELREQYIEICGQEVPVGTDLIFKCRETSFGIEICEDLWTPVPPSSIYALFGAEIIFNLSASDEITGKHIYRKELVSQQSARCIAGYVYAAAGNGESTTDVVFSGSSMIAENGSILEEGERFCFDSQLIIADIDIDRLKTDRLKNKSFSISQYKNLEGVEYRYIRLADKPAMDNPEEKELKRYINPLPFVPSKEELNERCSEIFSIQTGGLAKRLLHTNIKKAVVGVSGGLDSTLALLVIAKTYDKLNIPRENIIGITMPGFGTTDRTYNNALALMKSLEITSKEISIREAVIQHFKDIGHDINKHDVTYENSQARERTQILMDYANKVNGLVIGTGDLSELALGWCTYNGDHMSMYAVNSGIPKTLVKTLVKWVSDTQVDNTSGEILKDIMDTPISPELLPLDKDGKMLQITEDSVGPYLLHDFFLYNMIRYGYEPKKIYFLAKQAFKEEFEKETILKWLKVFYHRFFTQQFKRSCMPDGPKVGSINLSPRGDWRMPSDASSHLWLKQLDTMQ